MKSIKSFFARIGSWFAAIASPAGQKQLDHILVTAYDLLDQALPVVECIPHTLAAPDDASAFALPPLNGHAARLPTTCWRPSWPSTQHSPDSRPLYSLSDCAAHQRQQRQYVSTEIDCELLGVNHAVAFSFVTKAMSW
jgi:hypothetical protein